MQQQGPKTVVSTQIVRGNVAYNEALIKEPPRPLTAAARIIHCCCLVGFLCAIMNGYDGSLLNGLFSNPEFKRFFRGSNDGLWAGIVSSIYQIGGVAALPFVGPAADTWGRRVGMFIGGAVIIAATVVLGTTHLTGSLAQFMVGRFFVGFGVVIVASAGPIYVCEICHPAYRGPLTAIYNTFWYVGSVIASAAVRGALDMERWNSWILPLWLQAFFASILLSTVLWLPESPRWLYVNGREDEAREFITRYHGEGNEHSMWVSLQLREYREYLKMDGADKRWWDYRALFATRSSRYRVLCNVLVSVFGQWAGNATLSYFLAAVLDTAGITSPTTQLNINVALECACFAAAVAGALLVDRAGRRPLLVGTNLGCATVWVGISVATARFAADRTNVEAAHATQALIYLFGVVFSAGFTPLQVLYPVEVLGFELRAKGMAISQLAANLASLLNQFAWPVALAAIGWRTYLVFVVWCVVQAAVFYWVLPETKKRTLEELDLIFAAKNPRKASLEKKKLALDDAKNVLQVETA